MARKLDYLRKQLETLEPYRVLPKEVLFAELEKRLAVERLLELSLQSVIDCSRLLVGLAGWGSERDALLVLGVHQVISPALASRLLRAKGFHNILVHEYVEIDPDLLLSHLREDVGDLWEFARGLAEHLRQAEKEKL